MALNINNNGTTGTTREPSPVVMIGAFTESMKVLLGEIRGLASETFTFQLKLMELLPEGDRITAFKAVLDAHSVEVASDERIALALISMTEKVGMAAAAIIPPAMALRQAEIAERAAERQAAREEEADRKAAEAIRNSGKAYGKMAEAK